MYNIDRYSKALELDKVIKMLCDQCACDDSKELAMALRPLDDIYRVKALMSKTEDAVNLSIRYGSPSLHGLRNCGDPLTRASKGANISPRELLDIAAVLRNIRSFSDWRKRCEGASTSLDELFYTLRPNRSLEELLTTSITEDEGIADSASTELYQIRRKISSEQRRIREKLDNMIKSPTQQKYLQEPIVTMRNGRFVVPVKIEHRNDIKGLVHDSSSSGATVFVEPLTVVEANNEIRILKSKEEQEIERIIYALSAKVGDCAEDIKASYLSIVELDLYFAKAALAHKMNASVPNLVEDGTVELKKARHPLIEKDKVVPTDISIGRDFDILVITGPNTGGKTVAIKTLGLLTLMASVGLMIPARDGSTVSVFGKVLVDIGDEQSIEQSLSTFSGHMTNIISILENADRSSLVLIDELGAGTDPVEGAALAVAIIESLAGLGAKVAATTHYAEIKMYALTTPRVMNASCEFDVETLRPTYKLLMGIPGKSNAFAISSRLGLSDSVIERAKSYVSGDNARFEDVVSQLEASRQALEAERRKAISVREQDRIARLEFDGQKKKFEEKMQWEMELAQMKAREIVESTRAQAESMIAELDELRRQKDNENFQMMVGQSKLGVKTGFRRLEREANPVIQSQSDEDYVLPRPLKKGDTVLIVDLGEEGTVLGLPDSGGNVLVQSGIMKTKAPLANLRLREKQKQKQRSGGVTKTTRSKAEREVKRELDIRGCASDEGIMLLDRFIDDCVMNGVTTVTIIHGKGTGVLRNAVQQHMRKHTNIRTSRSGVFGEGEQGVTIAELK